MAISHLGIGKEVGNVETDRGQEAEAFNRFYTVTRDELLEGFVWPFATVEVALGLVEEDPTNEWAYSYRYPSNCLKIRKIQSGQRTDTIDSRIPLKISRDGTGKLIYCDIEDAVLEYTFRENDPGRFSNLFITALSYIIAFKMAPRLTKGDPFKLGNRAFEAAKLWLSMAEAHAANEEVPDVEPESDSIRSRY